MDPTISPSDRMTDLSLLSKFTSVNYVKLFLVALCVCFICAIIIGVALLDICTDIGFTHGILLTVIKMLPRLFEVLLRPKQKFNYETLKILGLFNSHTLSTYLIFFICLIVNFGRYKTSFYLCGLLATSTYALELSKTDDYERCQMALNPDYMTYGMGMAYSFFEGYLNLILPDTGLKESPGIKKAIMQYEDSQRIAIPVKKLFMLIPRSLECPPELDKLNIPGASVQIESLLNLQEIEINRAACKKRIYKNTVYKLYENGQPVVCVAAECSTPLLTFSKVIQHSNHFRQSQDEITLTFINTLQKVIYENAGCRGLCELIYYDDVNFPEVNVPELLLKRVKSFLQNT